MHGIPSATNNVLFNILEQNRIQHLYHLQYYYIMKYIILRPDEAMMKT